MQAGRARETQQAAAALKGSEKAAHIRAVTAAARAKEELEGSRRRAEWEQKLQRAGDARYEMTQTMLSSLALVLHPLLPFISVLQENALSALHETFKVGGEAIKPLSLSECLLPPHAIAQVDCLLTRYARFVSICSRATVDTSMPVHGTGDCSGKRSLSW